MSSVDHGLSHSGLPTEDSIITGSPVKQYALASILIVLAALVAVNFVSSRVERESVISRLETEALGPAKVSTFRIVEELSQITDPTAGMLLSLPNDMSVIDRIVLDALAGQQVARVDILDNTGEIIYSTDPFYIGDDSLYAEGPNTANGEYVGAAAVSGLDGHTALIEAVITRVPVFTEGRVPGPDSHETTIVMFRDVSTAIDAATSAGAQFRFWMVIGVMTVVFASLMIVVMRGHRAQNESRSKLQQLLVHEHMLVSELDQRNADLKLADESRLRLLSVVTHELGNPLTSISAFAGMLMKNKEENLSDRQLSMVAAINRGETQMRALVKDLLDLSRVEADELELELANLDVREIIDGSIDSMNPIFDAKFQTITSSADSDSISIDGDRTRLNQVITNLLSNASKYSPEGSNISVNTYSNESIFVTEITDDGIGISTEDKLQLFTPFFRSDNSETRQVPGNGLGLVICKQIVELHGGSLTVDSTKGQGTTVRVELPMLKLGESSVDAA
ncbi:MAG: HAMP domain-containing histidine kinase [Chloroflexi bacterium]|nr:HAMP domain-containing histidine kinase [Chloroflexota bacterium]MBT5626801.1 HAMP domain-containing histidine kinase [Chloroflexota bacterium]